MSIVRYGMGTCVVNRVDSFQPQECSVKTGKRHTSPSPQTDLLAL